MVVRVESMFFRRIYKCAVRVSMQSLLRGSIEYENIYRCRVP